MVVTNIIKNIKQAHMVTFVGNCFFIICDCDKCNQFHIQITEWMISVFVQIKVKQEMKISLNVI